MDGVAAAVKTSRARSKVVDSLRILQITDSLKVLIVLLLDRL